MTEQQEREAFEAWFEQERTRTWFAAGCDKDRGPIPSEFWAMGIKADWWTGWQARSALAANSVPMPTNADQAAAMALLGEAWLRENAPERLKAATPAPAPSDERAAFEAWLQKCHPGAVGAELIGKEENSPDTYVFFGVNKQWAAWQARAALAATPAPAPLTLDEIVKLAAIEFPSKQWQSVEHLVRAVERAHGIGQGKEASNAE